MILVQVWGSWGGVRREPQPWQLELMREAGAWGLPRALVTDRPELAEALGARREDWLGWAAEACLMLRRDMTWLCRVAPSAVAVADLVRLAFAARHPECLYLDADMELGRLPDVQPGKPLFAEWAPGRLHLAAFALAGRGDVAAGLLRRCALDLDAGTWPRAMGAVEAVSGVEALPADSFIHHRGPAWPRNCRRR